MEMPSIWHVSFHKKLGIGVGVSSGANFLGCILAQEKLGRGVITTVFADDNKKYLSTDYSNHQNEKDGDLTPLVELLGVKPTPSANDIGKNIQKVSSLLAQTAGNLFYLTPYMLIPLLD